MQHKNCKNLHARSESIHKYKINLRSPHKTKNCDTQFAPNVTLNDFLRSLLADQMDMRMKRGRCVRRDAQRLRPNIGRHFTAQTQKSVQTDEAMTRKESTMSTENRRRFESAQVAERAVVGASTRQRQKLENRQIATAKRCTRTHFDRVQRMTH